MSNSLTVVLNKIFTAGFYRAHAGMFLFIFLAMFGSVPGNQLLYYHESLMLACLTSPAFLAIVFAAWLLYVVKATFHIAGIFRLPHQQFLFYSANAIERKQLWTAWLITQFNILLPVIIYGGLTVAVGLTHGIYTASIIIIIYLLFLIGIGAWMNIRLLITPADNTKESRMIRWFSNFPKPYFSLFVYHIFHAKKLPYLITKIISWVIITGVFALFADVKHDMRVAGIAVLAIAVAHAVIVFEERTFEETNLVFARNLPYSKIRLFAGFALSYLILLLPEVIWLYARFDPVLATELMLFPLSSILLFHCLLYRLGLDMERYMQWVLGLFIVIFWIMMFKVLVAAIVLNLLAAFLLFYFNYYRSFPVLPKGE
ncbi:hypothetical protein MUY27_07495 [Mucilaginibacter sp. RS28]|uniref:Uncharacterized protein n=1 Tax=Mucilaginibacter straminoryzae TaxID=2932774 RepID=A0A9X1X4N6_9SPHI|nr:hypothetical protein [Mucilaginibacter straminoryzae]MCJ8209548.1 hypothetical protein [Mucilaginibacter straminoryzae]